MNDIILTNDNFQAIYLQSNSKNIWLYLNSTVSWLYQQLVYRTGLGGGAAKIQTYELAEFPVLVTDLESQNINLGDTLFYAEALGTNKVAEFDLSKVNHERLKLDDYILQCLGFVDSTEREQLLTDLYKAVIDLINSRLEKAKSLTSVKVQKKNIEITVYTQQLQKLLSQRKIVPVNTYHCARQLKNLLPQLTADQKLQQKILAAYWQSEFKEAYHEQNLIEKGKGNIFE